MKKTKNQSKSLPAELTTVTNLSKIIALIVFVSLPFVGFLLGVRYERFASSIREKENMSSVQQMQQPTRSESPVMCTMDAMMCPDGSYVGRVAPNCEFAPCPTQ